jgi:hypothetical protein
VSEALRVWPTVCALRRCIVGGKQRLRWLLPPQTEGSGLVRGRDLWWWSPVPEGSADYSKVCRLFRRPSRVAAHCSVKSYLVRGYLGGVYDASRHFANISWPKLTSTNIEINFTAVLIIPTNHSCEWHKGGKRFPRKFLSQVLLVVSLVRPVNVPYRTGFSHANRMSHWHHLFIHFPSVLRWVRLEFTQSGVPMFWVPCPFSTWALL